MSEYSFVEKPFLDQLDALDWTVIDQGPGIPPDPTKSLRASFREVTLRDVFNHAVRAINTAADGRTWLTDKQLDDLHDDLFSHSGRSLVENNEAVFKLLFHSQVDVFKSNPMFEAFQQLMRYSDQREETKQSGLREGGP
jgi:type I restriction enzyme R subunit